MAEGVAGDAQEPMHGVDPGSPSGDHHAGQVDGSVVLTGLGYRVNAWSLTIFFAAGAVGCVVLVPLAVGSLHKRADSRGNSIGLIVLCVLGVILSAFLSWVFSRKVGRTTSFDATGIRGLAVAEPPRNAFEKSFPRADRLRSTIPWGEVDHVERVYNPGAEGGGTFGVNVYLKDGRRGTAYVWSARKSTMSDVVSRLEAVRRSAARRGTADDGPADGAVDTASGRRPSRLAWPGPGTTSVPDAPERSPDQL